jgi:hypothetical protein
VLATDTLEELVGSLRRDSGLAEDARAVARELPIRLMALAEHSASRAGGLETAAPCVNPSIGDRTRPAVAQRFDVSALTATGCGPG